MPEQKYYTINALNKAFSVITLMSNKEQWELKELAEISKLPKGTLQRILLTLSELGFVKQDVRGGSYGLTFKFFKLGQKIAANNSFVEKLRPMCRQLMERIQETVNLCVALNLEMVVVAQQVSWQMLRLDSIIGSSFSIFPSASGKAYCAFLPEADLIQFLAALRAARPSITEESIENFCKDLQESRGEGVAFDYEEVFPGVRCVASPIFDYTGGVIATLACSVPTVRITEESAMRITSEVRATAIQMSAALGSPRREFLPLTRTLLGGCCSIGAKK